MLALYRRSPIAQGTIKHIAQEAIKYQVNKTFYRELILWMGNLIEVNQRV